MTEERKVDWARPIEAVHEDGRVVRVGLTHGPKADGSVQVGALLPEDCAMLFKASGAALYSTYPRWRIRNVAQPEQFAKSANTLPDDLTARMVDLTAEQADMLRKLLIAIGACVGTTLGHGTVFVPAQLVSQARKAAALFPEPVDEHEAYADALLKQQGWHGEPSIGFAAVARMIATAHEDGAHPTAREGE